MESSRRVALGMIQSPRVGGCYRRPGSSFGLLLIRLQLLRFEILEANSNYTGNVSIQRI